MTKQKTTKKTLLTSVLSLVLCMAMLIGTTFAWFTDNVTSGGNIIKSGSLKVTMDWAEGDEDPTTATWADASKGAIFNSELWEPGYVEAKHIKVSNVGTLALSYQLRVVANGVVSKLGDVIDVYFFDNATKLTRENVTTGTHLGTLTDIFGTKKNLANMVCGDLLAEQDRVVTIAFKMRESAGNEYQNLSIGTDFSVELTAIQHTYENDSFSNQYDAKALSAAVPAAFVRELDDKNVSATLGIGGEVLAYELDAAYQFEPTQSYEELMKSEYKYYLADFVVSADRDVPANSIALAGYYDAWCQYNNDNWVALVNNGLDIKAGDEIYLVDSLNVGVHYKDICQYGNDGIGFRCGIKDLTGENAGTTVTVKLCLFETTADPNGSSASYEKTDAEPIVIGEFKYTFYPQDSVSNTDELMEAIKNAEDGDVIALGAGTYENVKLSGKIAENLTLLGTEGAVVKGIACDLPSFTTNSELKGLTLKNVAFEGKGFYFENLKNSAPWGFVENLTMDACSFKGNNLDDVLGNRLFDVGGDSTGSHQFIDLKITNCTVDTAMQGIRVGSLRGECEISGNNIANIKHNAITIRSTQQGIVLVEGNEISNGGDRAFRVGVNSATIKYVNNVIINCGDAEDGSNFKANTLGEVQFEGNTVDGVAWNPLG